jgi:hypothetical protein
MGPIAELDAVYLSVEVQVGRLCQVYVFSTRGGCIRARRRRGYPIVDLKRFPALVV